MILVLCVAALIGCEESTMVGSGCPNGACPEALVRDDDVCVVKTDVAEIQAGDDENGIIVCLPAPLRRSEEGQIQGSVFFIISSAADPQVVCTDRAFLKPVSSALRERFDANGEAEVCEVVQLPVVASEDGGAPIVGAGDGFYYDDFSQDCDAAAGKIAFTAGARPWEGVDVRFAAAEIRNVEGDIDETLTCEPLRGTEPPGAPCSLPVTEYHDSQALIATNSNDCGQGVCLAYHLQGRTDIECDGVPGPDGGVVDPECARPEEIEQRMYCTCRCSGPPDATDLCDCPNGFSCVDVVDPIVPSVAGGYCVKNGAYVD
jgi:hypothetical protein